MEECHSYEIMVAMLYESNVLVFGVMYGPKQTFVYRYLFSASYSWRLISCR
jgi:hypothetical protein